MIPSNYTARRMWSNSITSVCWALFLGWVSGAGLRPCYRILLPRVQTPGLSGWGWCNKNPCTFLPAQVLFSYMRMPSRSGMRCRHGICCRGKAAGSCYLLRLKLVASAVSALFPWCLDNTGRYQSCNLYAPEASSHRFCLGWAVAS